MATFTHNYQLHQWDPQDPFLRTDFNGDLAAIDGALGALAEQDAALKADVAKRGNCTLFTGSYVGTGTYNEDSPSSFQFPAKPLVVLLSDPVDGYNMLVTYGQTTGYAGARVAVINRLSWSGNTLQWYSWDTSTGQLNMADRVYHVYAWLDASAA